MPSPQHPKYHGLTLVELLIASTIGLFIMLITANMIVSIFKTRAQLRELNEVQQAANQIIQDISFSIRWAAFTEFDIFDDDTTLMAGTNTYVIRSNQLIHNGIKINNPNTNITAAQPAFEFINSGIAVADSTYLPLIRFQFTISSIANPSIVLTPDVIVSNKRTKYGP
jgi:Tfp pilus assembly protein PilW